MKREFRFSSLSFSSLSENNEHEFAAKHALVFYRRSAIYSFIPKCGSSTMRYTLALDNGCISGPESVDWIHENNETFQASRGELLASNYAFTIMRCPYRRIASVFIDKVVRGDLRIRTLIRRNYPTKVLDSIADAAEPAKKGRNRYWRKKIQSFSFSDFVKKLSHNNAINWDHHWTPQVRFLVFKSYDDIFCLENFGQAKETLQ